MVGARERDFSSCTVWSCMTSAEMNASSSGPLVDMAPATAALTAGSSVALWCWSHELHFVSPADSLTASLVVFGFFLVFNRVSLSLRILLERRAQAMRFGGFWVRPARGAPI